MSIQEQLSQSQQPTALPYTHVVPSAVYAGVLGNQFVQNPGLSSTVFLAYPQRIDRPAFVKAECAFETAEMDWLVRNVEALSQYKGEWVLILGTDLLIHSPDFRELRETIRDQQIGSPFVYYVPTDDESNSVTI
jgi:hypothetical protein